jgi:hypothetical protein
VTGSEGIQLRVTKVRENHLETLMVVALVHQENPKSISNNRFIPPNLVLKKNSLILRTVVKKENKKVTL